MITVFGVAGGVLMHRFKLLQQACETWVAAMASAPVVLMLSAVHGDLRTQRLDHHHDRLHRRRCRR